MAKQSIVPFGPQHPVLPEPVHLDLVLEDEVVVKAVPSIGFVHRGLEKPIFYTHFPMPSSHPTPALGYIRFL